MGRRKKLPSLNVTKYKGQWLALHPKTRKIVGHGRTMNAAEKMAAKKGVDDPIFHGVPKSDAYFVGGLFEIV